MSGLPKELSSRSRDFFDGLQASDQWLPPGIKNLGIQPKKMLKSVSFGHTLYEWDNQGDRDVETGRAFGGWVAALSDHIVSMTMMSALSDGEWFTTMELTTRLFRPVTHGLITIEGRLVNRGRTQGFVEADWRNAAGKLLVRVSAMKAIRTFDEIVVKT